jgi:hypothetical protein
MEFPQRQETFTHYRPFNKKLKENGSKNFLMKLFGVKTFYNEDLEIGTINANYIYENVLDTIAASFRLTLT